MKIEVSLDSIRGMAVPDGIGWDDSSDLYYMSMVGCESEPESSVLPERIPVTSRRPLLHATRQRVLGMALGETVQFHPKDRVLYPNPSINAHMTGGSPDDSIVGPIYFFETNLESDEHTPQGQLARAIVFGHVSGAAAVVMGLMIGGLAGVLTALFLFLGSIIAGMLTLKHILSVIEGDNYLGGYQVSIPIQGPFDEEIIFKLSGSEDGILTEKGHEFKATAGIVLYEVVVHVNRSEDEGIT
ncbi:MAG: hypothetical protein OSB36_01145 [Longimicrobiales bacterium]|nr:hypothetical protein [Longimicrobiales bacterium]